MSYSAKKGNKIPSYNYFNREQVDKNRKTINTPKRYSSPNKTNNILNLKLIPNYDSSSTKNTNNPFLKENEFSYNSIPIKPLNERDLENYFIPKRKKIFKSPMIINNKIISFQRKKDKRILEFSLFDDKLIFKDINKSYLQDENNDDGDDSSDEKINRGKNYLFQEIKDSSIQLQQNLKHNQDKPLLSRRMRFKNNDNKE